MSLNLTSFLRRDAAIADHSLVDHSWWNGTGLAGESAILDISSMRNPNNIKPELELEWGLGGPDIDLNEPAGVVERNLPDEGMEDAGRVIVFARHMMNAGYRGRQVVAGIRQKFSQPAILAARRGLRELFGMEGLTGRILIDARGYPDCRAAMKVAANSPYKRFIKYVAGCKCGDHHVLPANERALFGEIVASTGNPTDDFMAGSETSSSLVSHCRSTMLPVLAAEGDLDKSVLDSTLIEMMNVTGLPSGIAEGIHAMKASNFAKVRAAFRWLDKQIDAAEDSRYAGNVDAKEFRLGQADMPVEIFDAQPGEINLNERQAPLDVELFKESAAPLDVEPSPFQEPELEGSDEIILDEQAEVLPSLEDVVLTGDMDFGDGDKP